MYAVAYTIADSPFGPLLIGATERGLARVARDGTPERMIEEFLEEYPEVDIRHGLPALEDARGQLTEYFLGRRRTFSLPLDLSRGSEFRQAVWREIARVPYGETISYSELAERAGNPGAVRAAAHGCAVNPAPLVIPCHRVLAKDGSLGGFGWGLSVKRELLGMERQLAAMEAA